MKFHTDDHYTTEIKGNPLKVGLGRDARTNLVSGALWRYNLACVLQKHETDVKPFLPVDHTEVTVQATSKIQGHEAVMKFYTDDTYTTGMKVGLGTRVYVQERRGTDRGIMKVLENNKPGAQFTLVNLYFKLVKFNHKHKNKPKMLAALDHLPRDDQLEFLEKNKYLKEATQLMLKGGNSSHSEVAQMLLRHGATRDALQHAEQGTDVDVRGKCHHSLALELYSEIEEKCQSEDFNMDSSQREITSHFKKAASAFEETENNNSAGMAYFFIALIQKRIGNVKKAFALFRNVSPFANEAGMVEALKIFVHSVSNGQLSDCQLLVTGAKTLLSIITTLLKPDSREKSSRCTLYLQFYGLHKDDKDPNQLMAYPRQRPLCADVLPGIFSRKEKRTVHLNKQEISLKISCTLLVF